MDIRVLDFHFAAWRNGRQAEARAGADIGLLPNAEMRVLPFARAIAQGG